MGTNADRYAAYSRPDKVRFMLRDADAGEVAQQYYTTLLEQVVQATGWSEDYARRHVKYSVAETRRAGKVVRQGVILQLTYKACAACYGLDLSWLARVIEVEMKTYLVEHEPGKFDGFIDSVQNSWGKLNTYVYQNGNRASKAKGQRSKSATIGSKKADKNVKAYKRQGEHAGLEVGVRGKTVKKLAATTLEYRDVVPGLEGQRALWQTFFLRCARIGFLATARELTERGIDLGAFFRYFTDETDEKAEFTIDHTNIIMDSDGNGYTPL